MALLEPTFQGHVATTNDAFILFEACLTGRLNYAPRRPHKREQNQLIRSGYVFLYEENVSGIKRWTDGVKWSPSRILDNFLIYRELDKPFPPGEKKRATRKKDRRPARPGKPYPRPDSTGKAYSPTTPQSTSFTATLTPSDTERQLTGSLINSYGFKSNGLMKKTMSVMVQGVTYHLVSYYNIGDAKRGLLERPSQSAALSSIKPRPEMTLRQSFRAPPEEMDENMDDTREGMMVTGRWGIRIIFQIPVPTILMQHILNMVTNKAFLTGYQVRLPMGGNFVPQMAPSPIPRYESLYGNLLASPHSNSISPTSTPTLLSGSSERPLPQTHGPGMYSQSSMQPRAMIALNPIDSRAPVSYDRNSYRIPNVSNPSSKPSIKYEDQSEPPHHASIPPYLGHRQPYYIDTQGGPVNQNSYQPGPPGSLWPGSGQSFLYSSTY